MRNLRSLLPLAALAAGLSLCLPASAAPFAQWFDDVQPDGSVIRIWGEGNDYSARFESADGLTIVFNPAARRYEYVEKDETTGALTGIGVFLGEEAANKDRLAAIEPHLRDTSEAARAAAEARWKAADEALGMTKRWEEVKAQSARVREAKRLMAEGKWDGPLPTSVTRGTICGFTLLVDFPLLDDNGNVTNTTATVKGEKDKYGRKYMLGLLNGVGWKEDGNSASVRDFYYEMSMGQLVYTNVCTDWILAPKPRSYYDDTSRDNGECARELIGDVFDVMKADPDFDTKYLPLLQAATLTGTTSGSVKAFNVLFAGGEASRWSYGLWAHKWNLAYSQQNKLRWDIPGSSSQGYFSVYQITAVRSSTYSSAPVIGTLCHEDGHMICGFPDYYHYSDNYNEGVGEWSLMCSANHLDSGRSPASIDAYSRYHVGWVTPIVVDPNYNGWLYVTNRYDCVYQFKNPSSSSEYFLLENRQKTGIDRSLHSGGIQIWRCRQGYSNTSASRVSASNYSSLTTDAISATNRWSGELSLEQADGKYNLERSGTRGDTGDVWYKGNTATADSRIRGSGYKGVWNDDTATCSRWYNGSASGIKLSHFSENGEVMRVFVGDVSTYPQPMVDIRIKNVGGEAATFTALVESWGSGASSADVSAEIGSDAAFSSVLSSTKIGTMTQLNQDTDWQVGDLAIGTPHYVRIKLKNAAGEFVGPVATLDYQLDENIPPAVDAPSVLFWQAPGNPKNWFVATDKTHKGSTSAKSGKITHNQTTTLNATVTGPGTFSFWWNVSSESVSWDWHAYTTSWNPATTNKIGGTSANWAQVTLQVPAGSQTISWSYRKDGSADGGSDCAWLDDVVWRPDAAAPVLTAAAAGDAGVSAVDVAWTLENLSTGATSCDLFLEYSTSSSFPSASTTTVPIGSATDVASGTWTLTGLAAGTTYYVRAKGVSNTNKTGYSEPFTVATANPAFPDFAFSVAPSETVTRGVVTIDVASFGTGASSSGTATIEYATAADFSDAKTATASLTHTGATSVTLARLSAGTTYYIRVTVRNSQNKSFTRGPKTFATADPGFYQPGLAQVRYGCTASSYPDFTVTVANNASTYAIERAPGPFMADIYGNAGVKATNPYTGTQWDWQDKMTYYYEGEMFFKGGVTYNFFHCVDDGVAIELDGEWLTRQSASNVSGFNAGVTRVSKSFENDGWHPIRIWVYEWSGGKGYVEKHIGFTGIGLGWNTNGCTTVNAANQSNWSTMRDPGDATFFRTLSGAELPSFVTLNDDLMIAGSTLTGSLHTDGIEDGCTVTLYAGRTNAGSNTVGWAQSFVAGTVPSEGYDLPFQWDDFCEAGDAAGWFVIARMTNPSGTYEGWSVVREPSAGNIFVVGIQEGAPGLTTIAATPRVVGFGTGTASASVCLEYSTDASFANPQTTTPVTATTTNWLSAVTISGLTPNTIYYVRTKGVKNGETVYSRKATISTLDYGTPLATVSVGTTTLSTIPVSWTVSSLGLGNTSADVFLDYGTSASYGQSVKIATVTSSQVPKSGTYTLEGLPGETTYHVRIRVVASPSGKVGTTADATGTTQPVGNPVVSATLGAVAQYTATFSYSLTDLGDGAASATLYYDVSTSSSFPSGSTTTTTIQGGIVPANLPKTGTATATGLSAESTYYLRVRAVNHAGKVGVSATLAVNTTAVGDPEVAVDMASVLQRAATASISIATIGDAAASATVTLEYGTSLSYGKTAAVSGTPAAGAVLSAALENLEPETTYYVRVTVRNDAGKTGIATTSFTTLEPADPAFTHAVTPSYTAASFALDVTKIGNGASSAAGYVRWGATSALSPELGRAALPRIVAPGPMNGAATGLSAGTTYYYEVVVTNNLAGRTAQTGSFKTETAGNLTIGTGYYEPGLIMGYRAEEWPNDSAEALGLRTWSASTATRALGAISAYARKPNKCVNALDGQEYPMGTGGVFVYTGEMFMEAGTTYRFASEFFQKLFLSVDGTNVVVQNENNGGSQSFGAVPATWTGWHAIKVVTAGNNNGNGYCGGGTTWANTSSPFNSAGMGLAFNTNGDTTVSTGNIGNWKRLMDAGNRHLLRARGIQAPMAFLDQEATWTSSSVTVPVRLDTLYDGLTLTVYASRSPDAWYFEDRWEKKVVVGSTGTAGAKTMSALFSNIDTTGDWYVSARLTDGANYDYWSDPVKFTPQIVKQPPAGAVTVGTPTFTSNTATVNVTSLGDETGTVAVVLEYATDPSFASPSTKTGTAVSAPGSQNFSLTGLQPGRTYYVRARLTGSALHLETITDAVSFTTPAYTPPVIASVSASATESTSATISVNVSSLGQGSGNATVKVFVSTTATFPDAPNAQGTITAAGTTTYAVSGLAAGTAYFVKVVVTGSNGLSATDTSASFVTGTVHPPAGTLAISGVGRAGATATATLSSLGDSTGAVAVSVEVSTDPAFAQKTTVSGESLSAAGEQVLAIGGLAGETTYYARAVFAGSRGGSPLVGYSETVEFTTLGAQGPAATLAVAEISFETATANVRVTSLGDDATSVSIALEIAENAAMDGAVSAGSRTGAGTGLSSFSLSELEPGRTYWLRATVTGAPSGLATVVTESFATLAYGAPAIGEVSSETDFETVTLVVPLTALGAGSDTADLVVALTEDSHYVGGTERTGSLSKAGELTFSWDGLSPGTTYYWTVRATGSNGLSSERQGQVQTRFHALAIGPATATVAFDGTRATMGAALLNLASPPATVELYVDGALVRTWGGVTAAGAFEHTAETVPGRTYRFWFEATAGGETVGSTNTFVTSAAEDWFNVRWAQDGYEAGAAWDVAAARAASGGSWTRPAGDESEFDGARLALVPPEDGAAVLRFAPSTPMASGADVVVQGRAVVAAGTLPEETPAGALGGLVFLADGPAVWTGEGWMQLSGVQPETGDEVDWKLEVRLSGEGAPCVRATVDGTVLTTENQQTWFPLPAGTVSLGAVGFAGGGQVGDFRGQYKAVVVGRFERPHFGGGSGGDAIAVGATTFSVTIDNASAEAVYGVYVCGMVDGDYVLGQTRSGSAGTMTFDIDVGDAPSQFVVIVAADPGYAFPEHLEDIEGLE